MAPSSSLETANGVSLALMPSAYDLTIMCRYAPLLLVITDSATDFTFGCVAGPETVISSIKLLAAGSACSEMIEKGWALERVGGGAVPPQETIANRTSAMIAVLSITNPGRTIVLPRPA